MTTDRSALMASHTAAKRRRDAAPLDSAEYRDACEEVARIEIQIAALEEPPITVTAPTASS